MRLCVHFSSLPSSGLFFTRGPGDMHDLRGISFLSKTHAGGGWE
jgi:hypothetical protein